ncbi:MAG: Fis family transcriptional regulator [Planctomycetaceae bacterium]|nr:Fis family transcriptional regulator [Planctomycetaceae bacterium]
MATILAIDDDPALLYSLRVLFEKQSHTFVGTPSPEEALKLLREVHPDVVFCDIHLQHLSGLDILHRIHEIDATVPVVMITGEQSSDLAIMSNAQGAFDFLPKPLTSEGLIEVINRALTAARLAREPAAVSLAPGHTGGSAMVGRCPAMQDVYRAIGRVATQRATVLILGESGTGKELVARAIHQHSGRADKPFITVNCAAMPETLLESELFGHEKGAFTGADRKRTGKFEQASGGTLFLDEIGETTPGTQVKLLRVLQEQAFQRVGGEETVHTDSRVIAATNRDLAGMAQTGRFRVDLFYRLAGYTIPLPPLRDRGDDLILLVQHFLAAFQTELGSSVHGLTADAVAQLRRYSWPGNLRELQGVLRKAVLRASGPVLTADLLEFQPSGVHAFPIRQAATEEDTSEFVAARLAVGSKNLYAEWLARTEPELFRLVLAHFHGNITQAAEALGINRMTLRGRIRQFGLQPTGSTS